MHKTHFIFQTISQDDSQLVGLFKILKKVKFFYFDNDQSSYLRGYFQTLS